MSARAARKRDIPVLVLGATGYTGRLICHQLVKQKTAFAIAGRSAQKLAGLARDLAIPMPQIVVPEKDTDSLAGILNSVQVLINCAGPFTDLGQPIVEAAIGAGSHYLDITGEQGFVRWCVEKDRAARNAECCLVPAMAFEVALSDMGASVLAEKTGPLSDLSVTYLATGFAASRGTRRSIVRIAGEPGVVLDGGQWVDPGEKLDTHTAKIPGYGSATGVSIPGAEIITIPRHVKVGRLRVYLAFGGLLGKLASWGAGYIPGMLKNARVRRSMTNWAESGSDGPPEDKRKSATFHVALEGTGTAGTQRLALQGTDPYGLTAVIAAKAAAAMLEPGFKARGCLPPSSAFPARPFLESLADAGVRLLSE